MRTNTFSHLAGLCSPKGIDCERRKGRIELTTPDGGTTAICATVAEALDTLRDDPTFADLPIKLKPAPSSKQAPAPAQHTPGPWKAQGAEIIAAGSREAWQLKIAILPTTIDPRPTLDAAAKTIEERDANARLIAAAPEMLAALEIVADCDRNGYPPDARQLAAIKKAISSAKGDRK